MAKKRRAAPRKAAKKASPARKAPARSLPKPNRCSSHGLIWFVVGVLIIANNWVGVAWPVLIGALISLMGLHKYVRGR